MESAKLVVHKRDQAGGEGTDGVDRRLVLLNRVLHEFRPSRVDGLLLIHVRQGGMKISRRPVWRCGVRRAGCACGGRGVSLGSTGRGRFAGLSAVRW